MSNAVKEALKKKAAAKKDGQHAITNMKVDGETKRVSKPHKTHKKGEPYWVLKFKCGTCGSKAERNKNGFKDCVMVCNGLKQTGKKKA